jgi:uncharacterized repeat protein (TIGR01451 family)
VVNTATLTGGGDITPNDNTGTSTTEVQTADLVLSKTATPASVSVGQPITWTITVHNNGPGDAIGATLTDTLPATITPGAVTTTPSTGTNCAINGQTLTCSPKPIANGQDVVITLTGTPTGTAGDSAVNTATVDQPGDQHTGDNSATSTTPVQHADLSVAKSAPEHVTPGSQIQWLITVHNGGPGTAVGATLHDAIPAGIVNAHLAPPVDGCTVANGALDCTFDPIAPGADVDIRLVGDTTRAGTVTNQVRVTQPGDPTPGNNTAAATTRVSAPSTVDNAPQAPRGLHHGNGAYPPCEQHSTDPGHCSGPKQH